MPIEFACPCGKRYRVRDDKAGRTVRCVACQADLEVPAPDAVDLGIVTEEEQPASHEPPPFIPAIPAAPAPAPIATGASRFEYRMVQMPPRIEVKEGASHKRVAADFLQNVVNRMALEGWDFLRVDAFAITENPGCLTSLFGGRAPSVSYYVATFRRHRPPG